ncbi:winged helix-turn-helix transcriptional regulator [Natronobacterium texcoconense]|uniref:winged helix-turn-helix transcriptional regulator n=1 Tax=Natronobacterium texcoconense TaxID=1095778 RepID=UPI0011143577|nr:metalloregulator ArsR/SmtB family transcription factor [Natronobacterium texcoconense]
MVFDSADGDVTTLASTETFDDETSADVEDDTVSDSEDSDDTVADSNDSNDVLEDLDGDSADTSEDDTDAEDDLFEDTETLDDVDETIEESDEVVDDVNETAGNATPSEIIAETGVIVGANGTVLDADLEADTEAPTNESDGETASDDSTDDDSGEPAANGESNADDDGDLTGSIPGGAAGAGVAAGASGLALLARRFGTAAALNSSQGAGAIGSTFSSLLTAAREWGWRVFGLFGYQRFSDDDPLEHDGRRTLYEYIRSSPGSYFSEISEETGVPLQSARYHLRILEFENLVESERIRGRRRYAPVGVDSAELEAALNDDATAAVLRTLADEGPGSVSELAQRLGRDPSTISHHLNRLENEGLVEREREGRSVVTRLPDDVERALDRREPAESTAASVDMASRP